MIFETLSNLLECLFDYVPRNLFLGKGLDPRIDFINRNKTNFIDKNKSQFMEKFFSRKKLSIYGAGPHRLVGARWKLL